METIWRITPWFGRLMLMLASVLFTAIGVKFLLDPTHAAAAAGISLQTAEAATRIRVGFGAFPISFAAVVFSCLVSPRRLLTGLWIVATVVVLVTAARVLGIVADGPAAESIMLLRNEIVLIVLVGAALTLETLRRHKHAALNPAAASR